MNKPELLAPAGDFEKLQWAFAYGADAVYVGLKNLSLRQKAKNFNLKELAEAVAYTHQKNKKIYLALNIIAHQRDLATIKEALPELASMDLDGLIVSDPGIISYIHTHYPNMTLHLSTQANTLNAEAVKFWEKQGIERVIFARELTLSDLQEIADQTSCEIELFIHGAMCTGYSGRCYLSEYMAGRDANSGDCAQPCRWDYYVVEKMRPGEYMPIIEDERGTTFFSSKDLCLLPHLDQLIDLGISSLKIEGRMKTIYYLSRVIQTYRRAIDEYFETGSMDKNRYYQELEMVSHRQYMTGFLTNEEEKHQQYGHPAYQQTSLFLALPIDQKQKTNQIQVQIKNQICKGDQIWYFSPKGEDKVTVLNITDEKNQPVEAANPGLIFTLHLDRELDTSYLLFYQRGQK